MHADDTTPRPEPAPAGDVGQMGFEHYNAVREGHEIGAADGFFEARPMVDTGQHREIFRSGFNRGFDTRDKLAAPAAQPASHKAEPAGAQVAVPVAYWLTGGRMFKDGTALTKEQAETAIKTRGDGTRVVPLYAGAPPVAQVLTDEQIDALDTFSLHWGAPRSVDSVRDFARAVLKAAGITEQGAA